MLVIEQVKRAILACVGVVAAVSCSVHNPAGAVLPNGAAPSARIARASVRSLCGPVGPGFARCFALVRTDLRFETPPDYHAALGISQGDLAMAAASAYYGPLGPAELQQAYKLPSATAGKGQTVGIVDAYSYPTASRILERIASSSAAALHD